MIALVLMVWNRLTPRTAANVIPTPGVPTVEESAASVAPEPTSTALLLEVPTVRPSPTPTPTMSPTPRATSTPSPPIVYSADWLAGHPALDAPLLTARAAIVVDYDTRRILYADHAHERRAQASTTKITTADVALDLASPDTPITITKDAVETEPDHMGVQLNEVLSVRELLYGLLLNSGNDAAYAIADGLGGTGPFVDHMNQRASQLKLQDTRFANPAGFDDPEHYSSAYDLIVLTTDAVSRHPELKTIFSTKKQIINPTKTHGWFGPINLNNLLWDYQGAWGVKPGLTDNADYCLVAAATRDGHTILAVVMGVPTDNHFREAAKLLDYGFKRVPEEP